MFNKLIQWSKSQHHHLPWRKERTLYTTLVSEIMLQQTTVGTVLNHYQRFLKKYPSIAELALESEDNLTVAWKGLGYYRRARNLKKACEQIVEHHSGKIPLDYSKLIKINGIGEYTANALLAIGADKKTLAIDANLERVLSRIYGLTSLKGKKLQDEIKDKFQKGIICSEIENYSARDFNEALMDLGREFCKANRVYCELCPMGDNCKAKLSGEPLSLPIKEKEKKIEKYFELKLLRVITLNEGKLLSYKKKKNEWLSGQYEVPTFIISSEDQELTQYPASTLNIEYDLLPMLKTGITKYRIANYLLFVSQKELENLGFKLKAYEWIELNEQSNFSTTTFKALDFFGIKK